MPNYFFQGMTNNVRFTSHVDGQFTISIEQDK